MSSNGFAIRRRQSLSILRYSSKKLLWMTIASSSSSKAEKRERRESEVVFLAQLQLQASQQHPTQLASSKNKNVMNLSTLTVDQNRMISPINKDFQSLQDGILKNIYIRLRLSLNSKLE
ncbi:hypothetical protein FF1_025255 [Malus domestica]